MKAKLKYTPIRTAAQYFEYCNICMALENSAKPKLHEDETGLLRIIIEDLEKENSLYKQANPVKVLRILMQCHNLKNIDLAKIMGVSVEIAYDILNYKRGFSKEIILKLAGHFALHADIFNRLYELKNHPANKAFKKKNLAVGNAVKNLSPEFRP